MTPESYFEKTLSLFQEVPSCHTDRLTLAGRTVHLTTPSMELRERLLPSIAHLIHDDKNADSSTGLTIWYAEDKHLPQKLKAPPWDGFNAQGYNPDIPQDDIQFFFQPWQTQLFLYSRSRRTGIYWTRKAEDVPWWEATFSFRILFHFWSRDLPAQLIHAGAMAKNGSAVLITGKSGSGKSTSCLNLLRAGYDYLGDDYVWVELGKTLKVHRLYQTAKIEPDNLHARFEDWIPYIRNKKQYRQQKAIFDIADLFPNAGISEAALKAILLPGVAHQEKTLFEKGSPAHTLMAMAPTTLHHLPHHRKDSYQKMLKISASLPGYHWHLGSNKALFISSFQSFFQNELA